jgi:hypothetical protein
MGTGRCREMGTRMRGGIRWGVLGGGIELASLLARLSGMFVAQLDRIIATF